LRLRWDAVRLVFEVLDARAEGADAAGEPDECDDEEQQNKIFHGGWGEVFHERQGVGGME
jgi:hypothetical protein